MGKARLKTQTQIYFALDRGRYIERNRQYLASKQTPHCSGNSEALSSWSRFKGNPALSSQASGDSTHLQRGEVNAGKRMRETSGDARTQPPITVDK